MNRILRFCEGDEISVNNCAAVLIDIEYNLTPQPLCVEIQVSGMCSLPYAAHEISQ